MIHLVVILENRKILDTLDTLHTLHTLHTLDILDTLELTMLLFVPRAENLILRTESLIL